MTVRCHPHHHLPDPSWVGEPPSIDHWRLAPPIDFAICDHFTEPPKKSPPLSEIEEAVNRSRAILSLHENWDDNGSVGYLESTWRRAVEFLRRQVKHELSRTGRTIPTPRILPGPDGSIDLHWKTSTFELLVNIQKESEERAGFYGDDYGKVTLEGTIDTREPNGGLLSWLMK